MVSEDAFLLTVRTVEVLSEDTFSLGYIFLYYSRRRGFALTLDRARRQPLLLAKDRGIFFSATFRTTITGFLEARAWRT
jgi:hypothetical protein